MCTVTAGIRLLGYLFSERMRLWNMFPERKKQQLIMRLLEYLLPERKSL